jgi:hypothetical protein
LVNRVKDIRDVVLKQFCIFLTQLNDLIQYDQLHIVVVLLCEQVEVRLDGDLDGCRSRSQLSNSVGTLKEYRRALGVTKQEDSIHESLLLCRFDFA